MHDFEKQNEKQELEIDLQKLIKSIYSKTFDGKSYSYVDTKDTEEYKSLKTKPTEYLKRIIFNLIEEYGDINQKRRQIKHRDNKDNYLFYADHIILSILAGLMRKKLNFNENEWIRLFGKFTYLKTELSKYPILSFRINSLPINHSIMQIEYYLKENSLSSELKEYIGTLLQWEEFIENKENGYSNSELIKASKKLIALISENDEDFRFNLKSEDIGKEVNEIIASINMRQTEFNQIFLLASSVSGSKPSAKFTKTLNTHLAVIGIDKYKTQVHKFLVIPIGVQPQTITHTYESNGRIREYQETTFLSSQSQNFIKGIVWTCTRFSDKKTIRLLIRLAEKCYTKIPGKGPAAASVGNACVYILGNMKGKDGLGALSRLKLKVRQNNVKKTIDKLLLVGAEKYNVSVEELKEMAVPNYGLETGSKQIDFEDYILNVSIIGSKVSQQWSKVDGATMKSVPSKVNNSSVLKKKLQTVRKEVKEIQKVFSAQKQRIDNQYILDRSWDYISFRKYYLDHGLVFPITSKLIWTFTNGNKFADAILIDGDWVSVDGEQIEWIDESSKVKLWHPINSTEKDIVSWRKKMMELEWKQPIKQAYREIYLLTEAEVNTRSYSNRMAAHILKQHQFSTLANIRNWQYSLMGAYDDGINNQICYKVLPEHNMKAEFWIDELNQEDAFNEAGIWLYIATDQVKFIDGHDDPINLVDIPKIVFTEVMRDVDMFVGVCSVGNDPEWIDNNGERQTHRDYWQSYSFGDLNEIAKTRKEILAGLLPRLKKIRDKAKIEGKFLIVEGKVRTYKIHIGSGNILMKPNDQYLCIVPSRSVGKSTDKLFIPFEGDKGLSIVLSKAFLLAEDDKIEDATIISQISRK